MSKNLYELRISKRWVLTSFQLYRSVIIDFFSQVYAVCLLMLPLVILELVKLLRVYSRSPTIAAYKRTYVLNTAFVRFVPRPLQPV